MHPVSGAYADQRGRQGQQLRAQAGRDVVGGGGRADADRHRGRPPGRRDRGGRGRRGAAQRRRRRRRAVRRPAGRAPRRAGARHRAARPTTTCSGRWGSSRSTSARTSQAWVREQAPDGVDAVLDAVGAPPVLDLSLAVARDKDRVATLIPSPAAAERGITPARLRRGRRPGHRAPRRGPPRPGARRRGGLAPRRGRRDASRWSGPPTRTAPWSAGPRRREDRAGPVTQTALTGRSTRSSTWAIYRTPEAASNAGPDAGRGSEPTSGDVRAGAVDVLCG